MQRFLPILTVVVCTVIGMLGCCRDDSLSKSAQLNTLFSGDFDAESFYVFAYLSDRGDNQIDVSVNISVQQDGKANLANVALSDFDKLLVVFDGLEEQLNERHAQSYFSYTGRVSAGANEYKVALIRNNVEIASDIVNLFPLPFTPTVTYAGDVLDIEWGVQAENQYEYQDKTLRCENHLENRIFVKSPDIIKNEHLVNSGRLRVNISELIDTHKLGSLDRLRDVYRKCIFTTHIIATVPEVQFSNSRLNVSVNQTRIVNVALW
ncbi:hypothetical protein [Veronia pacifica]|uniref:Uncharacterized protein n=1 Tax=Veronia pacifica TaxID=1080227 RepID=A0A1C3ECJ1_9GAMM|nr:hypothetical protein [Veronia pacifica]ODA30951.1 hypothetical protein A8L45_18630 [Veronia pacifica]